ncbi:MAG: NUDIX domain-containing protein [Ruminococcus sp.]|nr:NUDIX domain-containing protein [Ruminococcus sp.]
MIKFSTLCYIENDGKYLMLHRTVKENDINKDKWIGVGGAFKPGESPEECVQREVREETGFELTSYKYRGLVTFVCGDETEYMSLFTADGFTGEPAECDEGVLEWVDIEEVWKLNIWEGDKIFFRLLDERKDFFSLKLVYNEQGELISSALDGKALEFLEILKEDGSKSGIVRERGVVHREGCLHATVHMWVVRKNQKSGYDILLQKRSEQKESYPGCYDISSAGHIVVGDNRLSAAYREMKEELGIDVKTDKLYYVGVRRGQVDTEFHGKAFHDKELASVFVYIGLQDEDVVTIDTTEVESVCWIDYKECLLKLEDGSLNSCIQIKEFKMVGDYLGILD